MRLAHRILINIMTTYSMFSLRSSNTSYVEFAYSTNTVFQFVVDTTINIKTIVFIQLVSLSFEILNVFTLPFWLHFSTYFKNPSSTHYKHVYNNLFTSNQYQSLYSLTLCNWMSESRVYNNAWMKYYGNLTFVRGYPRMRLISLLLTDLQIL